MCKGWKGEWKELTRKTEKRLNYNTLHITKTNKLKLQKLMVTQQVHVKTVSRAANCLTSCLSFNRPFMSNNQMNRTAQGPEARQKQREKCTATNTITAITRVPMIHRAVPSAMHIEQNTSQKMLKGQTPPPPLLLYFFHSCPYVTSNPCSYFAPVPVFRTSSVQFRRRSILPIASFPTFTFPCKIIPLYFYNVVFHYIPY